MTAFLVLVPAGMSSAMLAESREFPGWNVYAEGSADITHLSDATHVKDGTASLEIVNRTPLEGGRYGGVAQGVPVAPSSTYVFSAWVKGQEIAPGESNFIVYTNDYTGKQILPTGTFDWQQISWTYTTAPGQTQMSYVLISQNTGMLWLDGLRVMKTGSSTNSLANGSFEQSNDSVTVLGASLVFAPGRASLRVDASASPVRWEVLDRNGVPLRSGSVDTTSGPATIGLADLPVGYYDVALTAGDHTTKTSVAVVESLGAPYLGTRPLGTTIHPLAHPSVDQAEIGAQLGLGDTRLDMRWENVEKSPGVYSFDSVTDGQVKALQAAGIRPSVILGYYNAFYDNGRTPSSPAGIAAFAKYAKAVAQHYGKGVDYEVYNEPNVVTNTSLCGDTAACYLDLVKPAIEQIRSAAPGARIVGPSLGGFTSWWLTDRQSYRWMQDFLADGGLNLVDVVAIHNYSIPVPTQGFAPENQTSSVVAAVRALIDSYPGGAGKPLWLGETGWPTTGADKGGVDEDQQARYLTRDVVMSLGAGAASYMAYDLIDDGSDPINPENRFGLLRNETAERGVLVPKPGYVAYAVLSRQLDGYHFNWRESLGAGVYSYVFTNARHDVKRVMWAPGGAKVALHAVGNLTVTALLGSTLTLSPDLGTSTLQLTDEPIYVSGRVLGSAMAVTADRDVVSVPAQSLQKQPVKITVGVNSTGRWLVSGLPVTFTSSTGQSITVVPKANRWVSGTLTIPAFAEAGDKVLTVTATQGGRVRAIRTIATQVVENPQASLIPVTEPGATTSRSAALRIIYGSSTPGVTVRSVTWAIGSQRGTLYPATFFR
ncbi:hypothetical protein ABIB25_000221 [Nakamurella sp. UYEF19]|uniref:cellulase family glycosylhydrolase n=1 Tax=Nakamurella sp. UYEF19 TaxID=1756392 RepID=UPI003395DB42